MVSLKALVFAFALTGCGDTVNNYYTSDDDTAEEETTSGNSSGNSCGDSDLTEFNFWTLDCGYGTVAPLDNDCSGTMGMSNDNFSADRLEPFTYVGRTVTFAGPFYFQSAEVLNQLPPRETMPSVLECFPWLNNSAYDSSFNEEQTAQTEARTEVFRNRASCALERDSDLFFVYDASDPTALCEDIRLWRRLPFSQPWVSGTACDAYEADMPWQSCADDFPLP